VRFIEALIGRSENDRPKRSKTGKCRTRTALSAFSVVRFYLCVPIGLCRQHLLYWADGPKSLSYFNQCYCNGKIKSRKSRQRRTKKLLFFALLGRLRSSREMTSEHGLLGYRGRSRSPIGTIWHGCHAFGPNLGAAVCLVLAIGLHSDWGRGFSGQV